MGAEQSQYQLKSLAITAILVAFTISAIWAWIWNETKQQNHLTSRSYLDRIEALEQQLQQRGKHEQDLLDRYIDISDLRTSLENNLTSTTIKMEYMQENLNDYQLGDWERKYLAEKKQPTPVVKQAKSAVPTDYRSARLISLMSNIKGKSSQNKLNILVKVIPTVSEGITTHELTALTANMSSGDILFLIKSSIQSIHKTKDEESIRLLLNKMTKADADAASKLLIM